MRVAWSIAWVLVLAAGAACTDGEPNAPRDSPKPQAQGTAPAQQAPTVSADVQMRAEFTGETAFETVEYLAETIGPREGTSSAFHDAAAWVAERFEEIGYDVSQVDVDVPRGDSSYRPEWGTVVEPGTSVNVIADPPGLDQGDPHIVIGAHLDTVAVSPGAEDNASGVGVVLELAELIAVQPVGLPVRFIAFGAEEPRGSGDSMHHFGSQQYVADLSADDRAAIAAMVALDRVGVRADAVPICTGGTGPTAVMDALSAAADRAGTDAQQCENRASDHWSFEKADIPAARLGSVPYAGYHSSNDGTDVVNTGQLERVGSIVWTWLREN